MCIRDRARIAAETHSSKYFAEQILDVYKIAIKNRPKHKIPIIEKVHNLINTDGSNDDEEINNALNLFTKKHEEDQELN